MAEVNYLFRARPSAVFLVGGRSLKVIRMIGLMNLRVLTDSGQFHDLDTSVSTNLFPAVWIGLEVQSSGQLISIMAQKDILVYERTRNVVPSRTGVF
jgi:hypothetical protein